MFAVYNMGTNDHPLGEVGIKVNDNQYHVIRFTRSGANSTLQVDDYNLQSNHPSGKYFSLILQLKLIFSLFFQNRKYLTKRKISLSLSEMKNFSLSTFTKKETEFSTTNSSNKFILF